MIIYQNKQDKSGDNKIIQEQNDLCSWKHQSEKMSGHLQKKKFNYCEIWVSDASGENFLKILLHKWHCEKNRIVSHFHENVGKSRTNMQIQRIYVPRHYCLWK